MKVNMKALMRCAYLSLLFFLFKLIEFVFHVVSFMFYLIFVRVCLKSIAYRLFDYHLLSSKIAIFFN